MSCILSADMAVDPRGELVDPSVDTGQVWSATPGPPADNANQEPATPAWCLTGQRPPRISLNHKKTIVKEKKNVDS